MVSDRPEFHRPRCHHCRDVVGIYEAVVQLVEGMPRRTSLAAQPALEHAGDETTLYHQACWEELSRQ